MAALTLQTCKITLPARAAARNTRARRSAVVAKAAAPVDAVRVQQKVRFPTSHKYEIKYVSLRCVFIHLDWRNKIPDGGGMWEEV